ncbi:MAG TPA: PPOX class F420-dependent oxidoreductase [Acidimicrobiales bacterium]|jgi:PPOX class probable F420-dependent enzyme
MTAKMTIDEVLSFLGSTPPRTGVLATTRADGTAHAVPVWYVPDDDGSVVFTTGAGSVKGRNLRRTGRAAFCVEDPQPPFSFVTLEGPVDLSEDLDELVRWAHRLGARYMGEERGAEFAARNGVPGELLVRLTPLNVVGLRDLAD